MIFTPTEIAGAYLIDIEPIADARGIFARAWCRDEFSRHGLAADIAQANIALVGQSRHVAWAALSGSASRRGETRALHAGDRVCGRG